MMLPKLPFTILWKLTFSIYQIQRIELLNYIFINFTLLSKTDKNFNFMFAIQRVTEYVLQIYRSYKDNKYEQKMFDKQISLEIWFLRYKMLQLFESINRNI